MAKILSAFVLLALCAAAAFGTPHHPLARAGKNVSRLDGDLLYHVSIQVLDWWNDIPKHICSGTLLNANWVLTTAKCIDQAFNHLGPYSRVLVHGGDANLQGYYTSQTIKFALHQNADLGLIKVFQPMREEYCCKFASLPESSPSAGDIITGRLTGQSTSDEWALQVDEDVQVRVVDGTTCGDLTDVEANSLCSVIVPPTTAAPVDPSTEAPVNPSTEAPVEPSTASPVEPSTEAPVEPSTEAPVEPSTEAPVEPSTAAPVEPSTEAPVEPSTAAPVEPSTEAPVEPSTEAPVEPSTEAPVEPSTEAPVEPSTEAPAQPSSSEAPAVRAHKKLSESSNCVADVGGPLVVDDVVVGIVSRGSGCIDGQSATVLINVAEYVDWIKPHLDEW